VPVRGEGREFYDNALLLPHQPKPDTALSFGTSMTSKSDTIGIPGGLAIVAGSMLGIGIFLVPPQVAGWLPTPLAYMLAWAIGGVVALTGARVYAELGQRCPRSGGDYVFIREAFGPSLGFAAGWVLFAGVFAGSVAALSVPIFRFQIPRLLPSWIGAPGMVLLQIGALRIEVAQLSALGLISVLTGISMLGTRMAVRSQLLLTLVPVIALSGLALAALFIAPSHAPSPASSVASGGGGLIGFARSLVVIYFAYAGWNAVAYLSGELRNPGPVLAWSLLGGTALITMLYLLIAGGLFHVLGPDALAQAGDAGFQAARIIGGEPSAKLMSGLIMLATLGSLNATIMAGARVGWALLKTTIPPHIREEPKIRSARDLDYPLIMQAGIASLLVLTGTFETLVEGTGLAMILMSLLSTLALFRLRREREHGQAPTATGTSLPAVLFLLMVLGTGGIWLWGLMIDFDARAPSSLAPLGGLGGFVVLWGLHSLWFRRTWRKNAR